MNNTCNREEKERKNEVQRQQKEEFVSIDDKTPGSDDFVGIVEKACDEEDSENENEDFEEVVDFGVLRVHVEGGVQFGDDGGHAGASEKETEDDDDLG